MENQEFKTNPTIPKDLAGAEEKMLARKKEMYKDLDEKSEEAKKTEMRLKAINAVLEAVDGSKNKEQNIEAIISALKENPTDELALKTLDRASMKLEVLKEDHRKSILKILATTVGIPAAILTALSLSGVDPIMLAHSIFNPKVSGLVSFASATVLTSPIIGSIASYFKNKKFAKKNTDSQKTITDTKNLFKNK